MALREEFESAGAWLFRRRSHLPLLVICFLVPVLPSAPLFTTMDRRSVIIWQAACCAVSCAGILVRIVAIGYAARRTSGKNTRAQVADALNTDGIYSTVRHPLYLGNLLIFAGVCLLPAVWWYAVILALAFWLYYERIMFTEEEFLRRKFGDAFTEWSARTPAFLPRLSGWRRPQTRFSWKTVVRKEYPVVFATVSSFVLVLTLGRLITTRSFAPRSFWNVLFYAAAACYVIVRLLVKKSGLLRD